MEVDLVVLVDMQVAEQNELILELLEADAGLRRVGVGHGGLGARCGLDKFRVTGKAGL
jgi:hypothetical protein